ncbi:hypothetical protein EHQ47_04960 [Leptospira bourretii]|uniref:hypothetical protein n=1 Tax=Leptospira bourretii TaxID=2484962 RepID=UPI0010916A11|nr:hypothetical protein [Leptospira bourretii]TGL25285.1 hypothetical protein EHQ47_04960 [Leptospira bourretii]
MNRNVLLLVLLFNLFNVCFEKKMDVHGEYKYNVFEYIPILSITKLRIGSDTERDILTSLGTKKFAEVYFGSYVLPHKIEGDYYPVDRIVSYYGTISEHSETDDGKNIIRRTQTKEVQTVSLFFYRGILVDYSVFQEYYLDPNTSETTLGPNATKDVVEKYKAKNGSIGLLWPEGYCDLKFYYKESGRAIEFKDTYLAEPCAWEFPNFDKDLYQNGYYQRVKEMDKNDFSHLKKKQSSISKW